MSLLHLHTCSSRTLEEMVHVRCWQPSSRKSRSDLLARTVWLGRGVQRGGFGVGRQQHSHWPHISLLAFRDISTASARMDPARRPLTPMPLCHTQGYGDVITHDINTSPENSCTQSLCVSTCTPVKSLCMQSNPVHEPCSAPEQMTDTEP